MSAPTRPGVGRPTPEWSWDALDAMRSHYGGTGVLPCDYCDRCGPCPCIVDPIGVHRAKTAATIRHRAAVRLAETSARTDGRAA